MRIFRPRRFTRLQGTVILILIEKNIATDTLELQAPDLRQQPSLRPVTPSDRRP